MRAAAATDIPAIVEIERASFSDPWPARSFADLLRLDTVWFAVMIDPASTKVLGYAVLIIAGDEGDLLNLAVIPDRRRAGLGARLLDATLSEAVRRGVREIFLEVRSSNAAARALYGSRGFVEVGRRPRYYRKPTEDGLILRCTVPGAPPSPRA